MPITAISSLFMHKVLGTFLLCSWLSLLVPMFLVTTIYPRDLLELHVSSPLASQGFTYHSDASEVRLVFFATDEHNRQVKTLHPDDFAVVDNDWVIRDFRSFTHADAARLDVIVLVDCSESVLPRFHQEIVDVLTLLSQSSWQPGDSVSMFSFSGLDVKAICTGNCQSKTVADRIASLPSEGATPLYDALAVATNLQAQRRQPDVWPVIILFSDGNDTISRAPFRNVLKKIIASEEQVYTVDLGDSGRPSQGSAILQKMAEDSGGRFLPLREGSVSVLRDVLDDLHSGLLVTYALPDSTSGFHSIRILPTHNLNLQFRCRRGYYRPFADGARQEDRP